MRRAIVPEATVDEDRNSSANKHDVGPPTNTVEGKTAVDPIAPDTASPEFLPQCTLGPGVAPGSELLHLSSYVIGRGVRRPVTHWGEGKDCPHTRQALVKLVGGAVSPCRIAGPNHGAGERSAASACMPSKPGGRCRA